MILRLGKLRHIPGWKFTGRVLCKDMPMDMQKPSVGYSLCLALSIASVTAAIFPAPGLTQTSHNIIKTDQRQYAIAPGKLSDTLAQFAAQAGVHLVFDTQQLAGRQSRGLTGRYSTPPGFSTLLQDSGYAVRAHENGDYRLVAANETTSAVSPVDVSGESRYSSGLPEAYAGGQVACGGRIGLLGNRDVFDTPFRVTNYTAELIENRQARTVADVIRNDSSTYLINPGQGFGEATAIRGFTIDTLYDGLPGLGHR